MIIALLVAITGGRVVFDRMQKRKLIEDHRGGSAARLNNKNNIKIYEGGRDNGFSII